MPRAGRRPLRRLFFPALHHPLNVLESEEKRCLQARHPRFPYSLRQVGGENPAFRRTDLSPNRRAWTRPRKAGTGKARTWVGPRDRLGGTPDRCAPL